MTSFNIPRALILCCLQWLSSQVSLAQPATTAAPTPQHCRDGVALDGIHRVGKAEACMVMFITQPEVASSVQRLDKALLVFIHGDGQGMLRSDRYQTAMQRYANALGVTTVFLQRPGYTSQLGTSDGPRPVRDDDYTEQNVTHVANALAHLRSVYSNRKILLAGHSGGSAHTALVAGRYPTAADAYLVIACACDIGPWREWRRSTAGRGGSVWTSLSPLAEASRVPTSSVMHLVVGSNDDNTLPLYSERYVAAQTARGMSIGLTLADGATHSSVLGSPELLTVMGQMLKKL